MTRFTFQLPTDLRKKITKAATDDGRKDSDWVRRALAAMFPPDKKKKGAGR